MSNRVPTDVRPEGGARCVSSARRDLCGGRSVMSVPTATVLSCPASGGALQSLAVSFQAAAIICLRVRDSYSNSLARRSENSSFVIKPDCLRADSTHPVQSESAYWGAAASCEVGCRGDRCSRF